MRRSRSAGASIAFALLSTLVAAGVPCATVASAATKDPVVIVAGTFADQNLAETGYAVMAARLRSAGYTVSIFGLSGGGRGLIEEAAAELAGHVDRVRASSGAARVDLIGHSQGGLVARYFIKFLGGAGAVDSNITLGSPNRGAVSANVLALLGPVCFDSCHQMTIGSSFLADLNAGDDSIGAVRYTNIVTVNDELVVPITSGFLNAADGAITNVVVQSQCTFRFVGHLGLVFDATVFSGIVDALRHRAITLNCFAL